MENMTIDEFAKVLWQIVKEYDSCDNCPLQNEECEHWCKLEESAKKFFGKI